MEVPVLDQRLLELDNNLYTPPSTGGQLPNLPYSSGVHNFQTGTGKAVTALDKLNAQLLGIPRSPIIQGGSILHRTSDVASEPIQDRFTSFLPGYDNEDLASQNQSVLDKATNGLLKGLNLAGTTFLQGTLGTVYGALAAAGNQKLSSFYDNDFSNALDTWNKAAENVLPNYYSSIERNAEWYSPDNLFKANFLWDKVIKNLGFSVGAIYSGAAVGKAISYVPRLFNLSKAGQLAETVQGLEAAVTNIPKASRAGKAFDYIRQASDKVLAQSALKGPGERALISFLGASTEAGIEALQGVNEYRDKAIQDYRDSHFGIAPTGTDLLEIENTASSIGNSRFNLNMFLLTATNYIQLPRILGSSYKAEKSIFNNLVDVTRKEGKLVSSLPEAGFKRLGYQIYKGAGLAFSPSEAFEEASQYGFQVGVNDYYSKKSRDVTDSIYEAFTRTFSDKEGLESILIGGISGGIQQARGKVADRGVLGYGGQRAINTAELLSSKSLSFSKDHTDSVSRAVSLQEERDLSVRVGDVLTAKDLEFDYQHNYLNPRIKHGRYDLVKSDIEDYKVLAATSEGFAQLKEKGIANELDTQQTFLTRLANFERHAANVNSLYQSLNLRYAGLTNKEGERVYSPETIEKMIYAASKVSDYDQRIPELTNNLLSNNIDIQSVLEDNSKLKSIISEIEALNVLPEIKDNLKRDAADAVELSIRRKTFLDEYLDIQKTPTKYEEKIKEEVPKSLIKIKTRDGSEELEIGTEYQVANVKKSKEGYKVFDLPTFTILAQNEDGTYKIQASNGNIRNVPANFLEGYKVGKAADLKNNKKAKFVADHINDIVYFNFGKDKGGKLPGRLWYDSEKDQVLFIFKNRYGKSSRIAVEGKHLSLKTAQAKGYSETQLTFGRTLTAQEKANIEEFQKVKEENRDKRLKIITDLVDETSKRIDNINSIINQKKKQLEITIKDLKEAEESISKAEFTSKGNFKKTTKAAMKAANKLISLRDALTDEISQLEADKSDLESNLQYFYDIGTNIDELPIGSKDFLEELKNQKNEVENLILETGKEINLLSSLINSVEGALDQAMNLVRDLISKFENTYPKSPTNTNSQEWIDFIQRNPNFLKLNPYFREDLATVEDIVAQVEDLDISPNEREIKSLTSELETVQEKLLDLEKEYKAKSAILDKFQGIANQYKKEQEDKANLAKSQDLFDKLFKSDNQDTTNTGEDLEDYNKAKTDNPTVPVKPLSILFTSTSMPEEVNKRDFHRRAEKFAEVYSNLQDKSDILVVPVTKNNQEALNLPGLVEYISDGKVPNLTSPDNGVIALVAVKKVKGEFFYLDENSNTISRLGEPVNRDQLIFSTLTSTDLTYTSANFKGTPRYFKRGETNTPEEYQEAARTLRSKIFSYDSDETPTFPFSVSAGFPTEEEAKIIDGKPVFTQNPIVGTLATQSDLNNIPDLIQVSTGPIITETSQINLPVGRPFFRKGNSVVYLHNRPFTDKEANTLFKVIKLAAKQFSKDGNIDGRIIRFLKSTLYFSTKKGEKPTYRNQIYLDRSTGDIVLGKNEIRIPFSENSIDNRKGEVIAFLSGTFNNVNNVKLKDDTAYEEILDVKDDEIISRNWKTYRHYLASDQFVDVSGNLSERDKVPLFTNVKQKTENDEVIFKGRYLIPNMDLTLPTKKEVKIEERFFPVPTEASPNAQIVYTITNGKVNIVAIEDEGKRRAPRDIKTAEDLVTKGLVNAGELAKEKPKEETKEKQIFTTSKGWKIEYSIEGDEYEFTVTDDYNKAIQALTPGARELGISPETALKSAIIKSKEPKLEQPVSSIEDRKADIERRKQEELTIVQKEIEEVSNKQDIEAYKNAIQKANQIGAKYDAELAALENKPKIEVSDEVARREEAKNRKTGGKFQFRKIEKFSVDRITDKQWTEFKTWMSENLPNISFERVKHLIDTTDGGLAWGVLENDLIKIYEEAEAGTEYHEAFEAVWKFFVSSNEQSGILAEFNSRKGSYTDRATGENIEYKTASLFQAKEKLADEFAEYKAKPKTISGKIGKFFRDLLNFLKNIFKKNLAHELFEKINSGYYKELTPNPGIPSNDYRRIGIYTEDEINAVNQGITSLLFGIAFRDNKSFFDVQGITAESVYKEIYDPTTRRGLLVDNYTVPSPTEEDWNNFVKYNRLFLKSFGIEFNESSDTLNFTKNETSNRDYAVDQFKINVNNSNTAMKLLYGTIVATEFIDEKTSLTKKANALKLTDHIEGLYGLPKLANKAKLFVQTLEAMKDINGFENMMNILKDLSTESAEFTLLYKRLKANPVTGEIDFDRLDFNDWRLLISFVNTFSKQAPTPYIQYIRDGQVYIESAEIGGYQKDTLDLWMEGIKTKAITKSGVINFDGTTYSRNKAKKYLFKTNKDTLKFLDDLGIVITEQQLNKLSSQQQERFRQEASNIYTNLNVDKAVEITTKTLDVKGSLNKLAQYFVKATKPQTSSVIYGVKNEQRQRFIQRNYASSFVNDFNSSNTLDGLLALRPELNNVFSENSILLKKGGKFFDESGNRINKLSVSYINGVINSDDNKSKTTDVLNYSDRLMLEINNNLQGRYYILVPADSSTEWMIDIPNIVSAEEMESGAGWQKIYSTFKGYLEAEWNTAVETSPDSPKNVRNYGEKLRFFRDIIPDLNPFKYNTFDKFFDSNKEAINNNIRKYVEDQSKSLREELESYGQIVGTDRFQIPNLVDTISNKDNMSEKELTHLLDSISANYISSVIEQHKLFFGDPAQFKDELKRIKSFLSPRGTTFYSDKFTEFARKNLNKVSNIDLKPSDLGYSEFGNTINTTVISDFNVLPSFINNEDFKKNNPETYKLYQKLIDSSDASAFGMPSFFREFKLRNGDWTPENERFYQYDMALARKNILGNYDKNLMAADEKILSRPKPLSPQEVLKPIYSGLDTNYNTVLDKYSIFPLYYSALEGDSKQLFEKMFRENISYGIVPSGRKVGVYETHNFYKEGKINEDKFNVTTLFWKHLGKQVETAFEEKNQTLGSQLTKLSTMDFLEAGVPIDTDYTPMQFAQLSEEEKEDLSSIYKEIKRNQRLLEELSKEGYESLLKELGIEDTGEIYSIPDKNKLASFLKRQILSRDPDINLINSFDLDETGEFKIPFEANSQYQQIKNILLAEVDRRIASPKVSGRSLVQATSAIYNTVEGLTWFNKEGNTWVKTDTPTEKSIPTSNALKFYEPVYKNGKLVEVGRAEVMLPLWFRDLLKKSDKFRNSDDNTILTYLNQTKDGQDILRGIGFRIPTQSASSIEVFVVKSFLDPGLGNTIIVPAEITAKAGSDFDIDKLNTYLKNVYIDLQGNIKLVPFYGFGKEGRDKLEELLLTIKSFSTNITSSAKNLLEVHVEEEDKKNIPLEELEEPEDFETTLDKLYRQSLENAYFDSLDKIILHPSNFERLLSPNSNGELDSLRDDLVSIKKEEFGTKSSSLIDRQYMTKTRHYFVAGKRGVGIAAINQTNHSLSQRTIIYIDPERITGKDDKKFLKDGRILLSHNTVDIDGVEYPTLSGRLDKAGKYISDKISAYINGFVDIAKDPFIVQIGVTQNLANTFLLLERLGVPTKTVVYFMNQPILRELYKWSDARNKTNPLWLKPDEIAQVKAKFPTSDEVNSISERGLRDNIVKYYSSKLTSLENAEQNLILDEFLKYVKLSEHLFNYTQATNYDTANFNDTIKLYQKELKTETEESENVILSVKDVIRSSFIGKLSENLISAVDSLSTVLKFEAEDIKNILDEVRLPFIQKGSFLSQEDLVKINNKISNSFLDFVTQTSSNLNSKIQTLITQGSAITALDFMKTHKNTSVSNNPFITQLSTRDNYLVFRTKDTESSTKNMYIASIEELLSHPDKEVKDAISIIVATGIIQSGSQRSPISFTSFIPLESYSKLLTPIIRNLSNNTDISKFSEIAAFERNNWNDSTIVPRLTRMYTPEDQYGVSLKPINSVYVEFFRKRKGTRPVFGDKVIEVSSTFNKAASQKNVIMVEFLNPKFYDYDQVYGYSKSGRRISAAIKRGENIMIRRLYQKVYSEDTPLSPGLDKEGNPIYVYKQINAWGNSQFLQEYYLSGRPSQVENNIEKVEKELSNEEVIRFFEGSQITSQDKLRFKKGDCK